MSTGTAGEKDGGKQILKALLQYLKKNNLKATEEALKAEAGFDEKEFSNINSTTSVNEAAPDITSILAEYEK